MTVAKICSFFLLIFLVLLGGPGISNVWAGQAEPKRSQGFLDLGGSKIYYEECGSGPNVVLLHDGLLHSVTWDESWDALCAKFHAVRYDRRGYGRSDAPKANFSPTDDVHQVMAHVGMRSAVIVGNSSGGELAIDFALAHPESVVGLFLIGPVVHGMRSTDHFAERGERNQAPLRHGDAKAAAENWSKDPYLIANGHDAARKRFYEELIRYPQNMSYTGEFEILPTSPAILHLGEIEVPTFVLVGEFDIPDVHAQCGAIDAGIPAAQRDIIKGDGHLIQLEDPQLFTERLIRFVNLQARAAVTVPEETLRQYVGQYNAGAVVTIGLESGHLTLQTPGRPRFPLFAESPTKFFLRVTYLDAEFVKDAGGKVAQMVVNLNGRTIKCQRM